METKGFIRKRSKAEMYDVFVQNAEAGDINRLLWSLCLEKITCIDGGEGDSLWASIVNHAISSLKLEDWAEFRRCMAKLKSILSPTE